MNTQPTLRPRTLLELLDAAFRLYRQHAPALVRVLAKVVLWIAAIPLMLQASQQRIELTTVLPLSSGVLIGIVDAIRSGIGYSYIRDWYGTRLMYYIIALMLVCKELLNVLAPAIVREPHLVQQTPRSVNYVDVLPGALLTVPVALLSAIGVNLLSGLSIVSSMTVRTNTLAEMLMQWQEVVLNTGPALLVGVGIVMLAARFVVAAPVAVIEELNYKTNIQRSFALTRGHWLRITGLCLLLAGISAVVVGLPIVALHGVVIPLVPLQDPGIFEPIAIVCSQLFEALLFPLQLATLTLLYYDLRIRSEGYDLHLIERTRANDVVAAHYRRAKDHLAQSNEPAALLELNAALDLVADGEDGAWLFFTRSQVLQNLEREGEALDDANAAVKRGLANHHLLLHRGILLARAGDAANAARDLETVLLYEPQNQKALDYLATAYYHMGQIERSQTVTEQLLVLAPEHDRAIYNLACMAARQNRTEAALAHLGRAITFDGQWRETARADDDFLTLQGNHAFQALVAHGSTHDR